MNHERLPTLIPVQEVHKDWGPGTNFWQILTGHQAIYTKENLGFFFNKDNQLSLPPSELEFFDYEIDEKGNKVYRKLQNPILVQDGKEGFHPQEALHQSWLGIQDSLRVYAFDEEGLKALQDTLQSANITFKPLPDDLGIIVETKLPAIVKESDTIKIQLGKVKINLPFKRESIKKGETEGVVFFLNENALQTPTDALTLVAAIAQLHPETAKDLMSSLLLRARVVSHNIQVWRDVLRAYKNNQLPLPSLSQLPQSFQDIFNQIKSYLEKIPDDLIEFEKGLTEKIKEFEATPLEKIDNLPLPFIDKKKAIRHLRRILEIASKEQENPERLQRLLRILEANIIQTPPLVNETFDPKRLLLTELAERGQKLMLDRMEPSKAMIKALKERYKDKPIPKNVRQWIESMEIKEEMSQLRQLLTDAENLSLTREQQKQYQEAYQLVEEKIKEIMRKETADKKQENLRWYKFPSHPVLAKWEEINEIISSLHDGPVKDKIRAVFRAKRQLAEKQVEYTNLFLKTTIRYMPGGYDGWNKRLKGVLRPLLEASPYFASLFEEPNCVGRMILLSAMLMDAQVFEEKDLVTMAIYDHSFLGGFDALGVGRVIEGSGQPKHSYFGIPKEKVFQGKVFNNQEIIFQFPLKVGLITEVGISYSRYLESEKARKLQLYLLQKTGYIKDNLWYNLALCLKSLDSLFSQSRAASINNFLSNAFYYLLYDKFFYNRAQASLEELKKQNSPLLPFIKLNLLVMKKALEDRNNTQSLKRRIEKEILRTSEFTEIDFDTMKSNLDKLLSQLTTIETPNYWRKTYGANLENATIEEMRKDIWNPDLFPKPIKIDDEGNVVWEYPS